MFKTSKELKSSSMLQFNINNNCLNAIRLLASFQVMIIHYVHYYEIDIPEIPFMIIYFFPGVPVFFFISGYVITSSLYLNNSSSFVIKRALRILPGYYICHLFSVVSMIVMYRDQISQNTWYFLTWNAATILMLPSWNPQFLRDYGVGVANGSLWTIPIEILFYLISFIVFSICKNGAFVKKTYLTIFVASMSLYVLLGCLDKYGSTVSEFYIKLLTISPAAVFFWIWIFLCGAFFRIYAELTIPFLLSKWLLISFAFIVITVLSEYKNAFPLLYPFGNMLGILNVIFLGATMLSIAYRFPHFLIFSKNVDLSYGIYLFHMPVYNVLFEIGLDFQFGLLLCIIFTLFASLFSWYVIEKPAIRYGKKLTNRQ